MKRLLLQAKPCIKQIEHIKLLHLCVPMFHTERKVIEMNDEYEYAVIRGNAYLFTFDGTVQRLVWEADEDNATWFGTQEQAYAMLRLAGLEDDPHSRVISRPLIYEEDIEPDELDLELDKIMPWSE